MLNFVMILGAMHIELRLISIMVLAEQGFFFEKVEYLFLLNIEHYYFCTCIITMDIFDKQRRRTFILFYEIQNMAFNVVQAIMWG